MHNNNDSIIILHNCNRNIFLNETETKEKFQKHTPLKSALNKNIQVRTDSVQQNITKTKICFDVCFILLKDSRPVCFISFKKEWFLLEWFAC